MIELHKQELRMRLQLPFPLCGAGFGCHDVQKLEEHFVAHSTDALPDA